MKCWPFVACLDKLGGHIEDGALAIPGQGHALDLLDSLLWQEALQKAKYEPWPLDLKAVVEQQCGEILMRRQQRASLQTWTPP